MTGISAPEAPELQVDYGLLNPDIHGAVERIVAHRADGLFRVAGIGPEALEPIREVLHTAEGGRLPTYIYDEAGNYVQSGRTRPVEERHQRVALIDLASDYPAGLWLQVPRYNAEPE